MALILGSIITLLDFFDEVKDVGSQGYTFTMALLYTAATIPQRIYEILPIAVLMGSLLAIGGMAANSELTAIRTAGVGILNVVKASLRAGMIVVLLALAIGEFVAPQGQEAGQRIKNLGESQRISMKTNEGLWVKDGQRFINIREVFPNQSLANLWVYELDKQHKLKEAIHAEKAIYLGNKWMLTNVKRSTISKEQVSTVKSEYENWTRLIEPELFRVIIAQPEQMSAAMLNKYIEYLDDNKLDTSKYELALWMRLTTPLSCLVMILLTVPFVFLYARMEGIGQRVFIGTIAGIVVYLLNRTVGNITLVYGLPSIVGAFLPLLFFATIGSFLLLRSMGFKPLQP